MRAEIKWFAAAVVIALGMVIANQTGISPEGTIDQTPVVHEPAYHDQGPLPRALWKDGPLFVCEPLETFGPITKIEILGLLPLNENFFVVDFGTVVGVVNLGALTGDEAVVCVRSNGAI